MNSHRVRLSFAALGAAFVVVFSTTVSAQSAQGQAARVWGLGQPQNISDLPQSQLRNDLTNLPPQASAKALKWLQEISFTGTDLEVLRVDPKGNVYFVDPIVPVSEGVNAADSVAGPVTSQGSAVEDVFLLHSRPGAPNRLYLDFNGHTFSNTAWGSGTFAGVAYDIDGIPGSFSDTEKTRIADIWHRVAEDLAPFNIDVTTEEPAAFDRYTGRVLITRDVDATGKNMPSKGAGGVAYVNVFGLSNYHTYYSPALVYFNNLGGGESTYTAEASSHEFGHNLGLSHDGTTTGTTYYAGHGSGLVSWAPIMGNSYYNNVTEWSKGEYTNANQTQDDLAIIQAKLGLRADDHGNAIGSGTPLQVDPDGSVVASNPELDPHNVLSENKGVIHSAADVDVFTFNAAAGAVNLTIRPAWDAFYRSTSRRGANLDILAQLKAGDGSVIASSDPTTDTYATIGANVAAGTYHLFVSGVGNTVTPYSDYDSLGQYFIDGTIVAGSTDSQPPTPNPMTWASPPAATSSSAIQMTASTATDNSGAVQYRFSCVAGGAGCTASAWQSGTSYTASGLAASTQYTFNVTARDLSGNQTSASAPASATTQPPPAGDSDFVAASETRVAGSVSGSFTNTRTDDGTSESISEALSSGSNSTRYSYLEHRWTFQVGAGSSVRLYANAWSGGSTDGDTFDFQYSLNGGSTWTTAFNVSSTSSANTQSFLLSGTPSGTILVRVIDTNRVAGRRERNRVYVDHLYFRVSSP